MKKQIHKKQDEEISFATNKKNMLKFKLVFIGDQSVGKSSIINRFIKNKFDPSNNPTVGIDFVSKNFNIEGTAVRLQLWDTAGQQRFRSLIPGYLRDCQAAFIVFDLTHKQTFDSVHSWIDFVKQSRGDDPLIYIIGNKDDLQSQRAVSSLQASEKSKEWGYKYFEVSAKAGTNLAQLFKEVCDDLLKKNYKPQNVSVSMKNSKQVQMGRAEEDDNLDFKQQNQTQQIAKINKQNSKLVTSKDPKARRIKQKNCC